jgi:hypothetical protein
VTFRIDGYTQSNRLKYAGDNSPLTDGFLTVDNTTIETESVLVDLKFAAAKRFSETDFVLDYPLYDIKIESGVLIRNPIKQDADVLAEIVQVSGDNTLKFTDAMKFSSIVADTAYAAYQSIIEQPRIIKERFRLEPDDVAGLSLEIPVYLQQYGKYYAVLSAQIKENGETECEMLEIKL